MPDEPQPDLTALRRLQDSLVARAEKLVLDLRPPTDERGRTRVDLEEMARSQASKAIAVAEASETIRVFLNWARYQAGRDRSRDFWSCPLEGGGKLVDRLRDDLEWLGQQVDAQVPDAGRRLPTLRKAAALYLGYFRRALIGYKTLAEHARAVEGARTGGQT
jgi:hypothetical protein